MKAKLQKFGNSKGIRIPKTLIEEIGLETAVELTVENNRLVISPARNVRQGWSEAFANAPKENTLLIPDTLPNTFDDTEWTW